MFIHIDGHLVNLDRVCEIVPQKRKGSDGLPIVRALFHNGDVGEYRAAPEYMERFAGSLVPAPPGFTMVSALMPEKGEDAEVSTFITPVIAFRVTGGTDAPVPVTVEGEPLDSTPYAVIRPDGKVSAEGNTFVSVESWIRFLRREDAELDAPEMIP